MPANTEESPAIGVSKARDLPTGRLEGPGGYRTPSATAVRGPESGYAASLPAPNRSFDHGSADLYGKYAATAVSGLTPAATSASVASTYQGGKVSTSANTGPLGQPRGIGFGILIFIVTLGFYSWYWVYKTEEEMKLHTGEGLGGVLGLVIWIVLHPVMAFVIPSEIGKMYKKDGQEPPMSGWTGLWLFPFGYLIIPAIVWFVKVQEALNRSWEGKTQATVPVAS